MLLSLLLLELSLQVLYLLLLFLQLLLNIAHHFNNSLVTCSLLILQQQELPGV